MNNPRKQVGKKMTSVGMNEEQALLEKASKQVSDFYARWSARARERCAFEHTKRVGKKVLKKNEKSEKC